MSLTLIFSIIVFILVAVILFKLIHSVVKVISILFFIALLFGAIFGYFAISDARDLSQNFGTEPKLFLLDEGGEITSAVELVSFEGGNFDVWSLDKLNNAQSDFEDKNYDKLIGDNWKLFVIKMEALEEGNEFPFKFGDDGTELTKEQLIRLLKSDEPRKGYFDLLFSDKIPADASAEQKEAMMNQVFNDSTDSDIRGQIFLITFANSMSNDPVFLFREYKNNNIDIYPSSILFDVIRMTPKALLFNLMKKTKSEVETQVEELK